MQTLLALFAQLPRQSLPTRQALQVLRTGSRSTAAPGCAAAVRAVPLAPFRRSEQWRAQHVASPVLRRALAQACCRSSQCAAFVPVPVLFLDELDLPSARMHSCMHAFSTLVDPLWHRVSVPSIMLTSCAGRRPQHAEGRACGGQLRLRRAGQPLGTLRKDLPQCVCIISYVHACTSSGLRHRASLALPFLEK